MRGGPTLPPGWTGRPRLGEPGLCSLQLGRPVCLPTWEQPKPRDTQSPEATTGTQPPTEDFPWIWGHKICPDVWSIRPGWLHTAPPALWAAAVGNRGGDGGRCRERTKTESHQGAWHPGCATKHHMTWVGSWPLWVSVSLLEIQEQARKCHLSICQMSGHLDMPLMPTCFCPPRKVLPAPFYRWDLRVQRRDVHCPRSHSEKLLKFVDRRDDSSMVLPLSQ